MAYVSPPIENAETSCAWPSTLKPPLPLVAEPAGTSAGGCAALISMSFMTPSEPGEPGAGRARLASVPSALRMLPPLRDSAPAPA